jgi:hypothetical protein
MATPLITPALRAALTRQANNGEPEPIGQIIISLLPNMKVRVTTDVANRVLMNAAMITAHQDLMMSMVDRELNPPGDGGIQVANQEMVNTAAQAHNGIKLDKQG